MSYMSAPRLHQSTARLCPLLMRISGALRKEGHRSHSSTSAAQINPQGLQDSRLPYMYSMVPQKVWVYVPSWMDSLHRPKSVSFTCPAKQKKTCFRSQVMNKSLKYGGLWVWCTHNWFESGSSRDTNINVRCKNAPGHGQKVLAEMQMPGFANLRRELLWG